MKRIQPKISTLQIEQQQRLKEKLPHWYVHPDLCYPSSIALQQASSQESALYKQRFVQEGDVVVDITGGFGVDCAAFAPKVTKVIYIEKDEALCRLAKHNFKTLGYCNIEVLNGSCLDLIPHLPPSHLIYIDPSRRDIHQKRLFALSDCEPDIIAIKELLLKMGSRVLIKISPMADIRHTLRLLPETVQVHVVAVKNECKELLFLLEQRRNHLEMERIPIHCVDLDPFKPELLFHFTLEEEKQSLALMASENMQGWLYESNVSIRKAGAFKLPTKRFGMFKLHPHTHLYYAPTYIDSFPGRIFHITEVLTYKKQTIKTLHQSIPQANIAVRNFCLEALELKKRLKIKDGGDIYIFGVTLFDGRYALILSTKEK